MNNRTKKYIHSVIYFANFFFLILNGLGIFILYPRDLNLGFDYIGAIVGILSLLVSFLAIMFGYNILGIKRQITKEVDNKSNNLREEITNTIIENEIEHNIILAQFHQKKEKWDDVILMCTRTAVCYAKCQSATRIELMYQLIENACIESNGKLDSLTIQSLIDALKDIKDLEAYRQIQALQNLVEQNYPKVDKQYDKLIIVECIKKYSDKKGYCYHESKKGWGCKHLNTTIDIKTLSEEGKAKLFSKVYREAKYKGIIDCPHFRSLNLDEALNFQ